MIASPMMWLAPVASASDEPETPSGERVRGETILARGLPTVGELTGFDETMRSEEGPRTVGDADPMCDENMRGDSRFEDVGTAAAFDVERMPPSVRGLAATGELGLKP